MYIYRERERERCRNMCPHTYIYIYIYCPGGVTGTPNDTSGSHLDGVQINSGYWHLPYLFTMLGVPVTTLEQVHPLGQTFIAKVDVHLLFWNP